MLAESLRGLAEDYEKSGFWRMMGFKMHRLELGAATVAVENSSHLLNVNGGVHGGVITSILDAAMGATLRTVLEVPVVTQSMSIQFLRAPRPDCPFYATGQIVKRGSRVVVMQGRVEDERGGLLALAIATFIPLYPISKEVLDE